MGNREVTPIGMHSVVQYRDITIRTKPQFACFYLEINKVSNGHNSFKLSNYTLLFATKGNIEASKGMVIM